MSSKYLAGSFAVLAAGGALALYMGQRAGAGQSGLFSSFRTPMVLSLQQIEQVNHDTKRLRFRLPNNSKAGFPVASAMLCIVRPANSWLPTIRPYTPISDSSAEGHIDFLIKRYPSGAASGHLHDLTQGDKVYFAGHIRGPQLKANAHRHITLIAGGTGITPCFQALNHILSDENDATKVTLVHGVNTEDDMVLADELKLLRQRYPDRFNFVHCISAAKTLPDGTLHGRVDADALQHALKGIDVRGGQSAAYICGPPAMEVALKGTSSNPGVLGKVGFAPNRVFSF